MEWKKEWTNQKFKSLKPPDSNGQKIEEQGCQSFVWNYLGFLLVFSFSWASYQIGHSPATAVYFINTQH